jgi:hypothetical protein
MDVRSVETQYTVFIGIRQLIAVLLSAYKETSVNDTLRLIQLTDWYQSVPGQYTYAYQCQLLKQILPQHFGYQLLQIGGPQDLSWLQHSPIRKKIQMVPTKEGRLKDGVFQGGPMDLPFAKESLDLIFLPHTLECIADISAVLMETADLLTSRGVLLIMGFNPWSLGGAQRYLHTLRHTEPYFPWMSQRCAVHPITQMLSDYGLSVESISYACYGGLAHPPSSKQEKILTLLGSLLSPNSGTLYCIQAYKERMALTPLCKEKKLSFDVGYFYTQTHSVKNIIK